MVPFCLSMLFISLVPFFLTLIGSHTDRGGAYTGLNNPAEAIVSTMVHAKSIYCGDCIFQHPSANFSFFPLTCNVRISIIQSIRV